METLIVMYSVSDAAIAELKTKHSGLTVAKDGTKAVHNARMIIKEKRVEVEKTRKKLKADSLEYGRKVDAEANRITELLEAIEKPLEAEENAENIRLEAIKAEKERKEAEQLNNRIATLSKIGAAHDVTELKLMSEDAFNSLHKEHMALFAEAEQKKVDDLKRIAEEKAAEEKRMTLEREELAMAKKAQEEREVAFKVQQYKEQAELRKAQEAIRKTQEEREKAIAEKERLIREEELKKEAAEKALKAESERLAKIEKEKQIADSEASIKAKRKSELAPDKEKLLKIAFDLKNVSMPTCKHKDAIEAVKQVEALVKHCINSIGEIAETL